MISTEFVDLLQNEVNRIIENDSSLTGYTCTVRGEVNYENLELDEKHIEANVIFGSISQENDLSNKMIQNAIIYIQSEVNGFEAAKQIFYTLFLSLNRTFQDLGTYKTKLFFTGPTLSTPFVEYADGYICSLSMQCTLEYSTGLLTGAKYELKLIASAFSSYNYEEVKPMTPSTYKKVIGQADLQIVASNKDYIITKQGNEYGYILTLLVEYPTGADSAATNRRALFEALLNEAFYGTANQKFKLKISLGAYTTTVNNVTTTSYRYVKELEDLIITTANLVYDEASGDVSITLCFARGD